MSDEQQQSVSNASKLIKAAIKKGVEQRESLLATFEETVDLNDTEIGFPFDRCSIVEQLWAKMR